MRVATIDFLVFMNKVLLLVVTKIHGLQSEAVFLTYNSLFSGKRMRQRRRRTAYTEEQLDRLEESFMEEKFPGIIIREQLAEELNIKEDRIQVS